MKESIKVFLLGHIKEMVYKYDISVITNTNNKDFLKPFDSEVALIPLRIERKISPLNDFMALMNLLRIFRKKKFKIVHSIMPKSGLISMLAALFAGIPVRIHTFTGQVWVTKKGLLRWILKSMDKIVAACTTNILVDSHSQRLFLINQGIISKK